MSESVIRGGITTQPPLDVAPLETGDRLTRAEFERRYDAMPDLKKAELIEGVVVMPSPVRLRRHSEPHAHLVAWLGAYKAVTPGVIVADNASIRLDLDNEPQPDAALLIDPNCGGQARITDDDYIDGAPELVAEITSSSVSYDLGDKLQVFRRNGVREYVVWRVLDQEIDWFVLHEGRYERQESDVRGGCQSMVFAGLWLDVPAMLQGDLARVLTGVQQATATSEHARFAERFKGPQ